MSEEVQTRLGAIESAHQRLAERAAEALASALRMAGLPPLPSLEPHNFPATGMLGGGHVNLGGANAHAVMAYAAYISEAAARNGRQLHGSSLDPRAALTMPELRPATYVLLPGPEANDE
jgi:hypothetical protein